MQYAKSIRFAGMLLDAKECDYTAFLNHGLRCPVCSGTVFLVAGSTRDTHSRKMKDGGLTNVKESTIPAHFSHHSTDKVLIADCELRSAKITQVQRQAFQAQARGQVARIFRQKFFSMVKTSIKLHDIDHIDDVLLSLWQSASIKQPMASKAQLMAMIDLLSEQFAKSSQLGHTKDSLDTAVDKWIELLVSDPNSVPAMYRAQFAQWSNVLDKRMQVLIVAEALDYLCHKAQKPVLDQLIKCALYAWILAEASCQYYELDNMEELERSIFYNKIIQPETDKSPEGAITDYAQVMVKVTRSMIGLNREAFEALFYFVRDDVVQMLTFVDWAKQFEDREK